MHPIAMIAGNRTSSRRKNSQPVSSVNAGVVATSGEGMSQLQAHMLAVVDGHERGGFRLALDDCVEQALLRRWLAELSSQEYARGSIARRLSELRSFFRFLVAEDPA